MHSDWVKIKKICTGGSRGGAQGPPLFWAKKITEGRKASRASKKLGPPYLKVWNRH